MNTKKMTFLSLLVAGGLALGLLELYIPMPFSIPGAKAGLSNAVVLITIIFFGYTEGLTVALLKTVLLMLLTGSVSSFMFSFAGAILSSLAMILSHKYLNKYLSTIGISIIGSTFHNIGQVTVAAIVLNSTNIFSYLPFLMIFGIITGYFVGLVANMALENLKKTFKEQL
ncbi:Gx transporter family protein [Peptoniphilus catoniae]|uniref:Gx transporter family protein n=1 Tax=Peptoniphilus catoniae TaxID=1660341 RepID=UPI0010FD360A|nr:Gx transporter family protein [Peptoniphilus catoniae]